jgi:2,4-diaminopentanoate dehydrogenase
VTDSRRPIRVIQWCTGKIGQIMIRHFAANPELELVGVFTTSTAKEGIDAGELAGIDDLGIRATTDKESLFSLAADCVSYMPLLVDVDDMEALLRSGKNIVTPVGLTFPPPGDERTERLEAACRDGGSSLHGGGIHPGFAGDLLPLISSRLLSRIDQVVVSEVCDFSRHPGRAMLMEGFGFGRDPEEAVKDPGPVMRTMPGCFDESINLLATGLGLQVDEIVNELTVAVSDRDLTVAAGLLPAGTVAGMRHRWTALVQGRPLIVFQSNWKMADGLTPDIAEGTNRYVIEFLGEPSTKITLEPLGSATGDPGYPGRIWTGMAVTNMIRAVVAAEPGIRTHLDLPIGQARGLFHEGTTWQPAPQTT